MPFVPFTDGNKRTGRIINSLCLIEQQLLSLPVLTSAGTFFSGVLITIACSSM